jgi:hypothetical protein
MSASVPGSDPTAAEDHHELAGQGTEAVPRSLHVTCPQGHRLEAPCVLDGRDVVCPYCSDRFLFCYEESEEYERDKDGYQEPQKTPPCWWLPWAAVAALTTLVGVAALRVLAQTLH